jgi:hypothetical protein
MKTKLSILLLLASSSVFAAGRVFFGVNVGVPIGYAPPPPPAYVAYAPPYPGYGYTWVAGYYYPVGPRWYWHTGYWARPPYIGARWYAPRYYRGRYYAGYWRR